MVRAVEHDAARLRASLAAMRAEATERHDALRAQLKTEAEARAAPWGHYLLRAAVVKCGAHYVSFARDEADPSGATWIKSDDHRVSRCTLAEAQQMWRGTPAGDGATQLFYENEAAIESMASELAASSGSPARSAPLAAASPSRGGAGAGPAAALPPTIARQVSQTSEMITSAPRDELFVERVTGPIEWLAASLFAKARAKKAEEEARKARLAADKASARALTAALSDVVLEYLEPLTTDVFIRLGGFAAAERREILHSGLESALATATVGSAATRRDAAQDGALDAMVAQADLIVRCVESFYGAKNTFTRNDRTHPGIGIASVITLMLAMEDIESLNMTLQFSYGLPPIACVDPGFFGSKNPVMIDLFNSFWRNLKGSTVVV